MKEREFRAHLQCSFCKRLLGETGLPAFYRLTLEEFAVSAAAVRRRIGLGMMLGNERLAQVMGPDEEMAELIGEKHVLVACMSCAMMEPRTLLTLRSMPSTVHKW